MAKMIVEFEWSDELGDDWMDLQTLEHLLYGQAWTKREYLSATDLTDKGIFIPKKNYDGSELKQRIVELEAELNTERMLTQQLNKNLKVSEALLSTMNKI